MLIESGRTERFHNLPHHLPYSVAQHSWNMVAILEVLYPDAPVRLVKACLFHDSAERWTGDMPAPGKWWLCPEANSFLKEAEAEVLSSLQVNYADGLRSDEKAWLKALDLLELYLYCWSEMDMGNRGAEQAYNTCKQILEEDWVPGAVKQFIVSTVAWDRSDDTFGHR